MLSQRRVRWWVVVVLLLMLAGSVGAIAAPPAGLAQAACDEGADDRFEFWRPVCSEHPELAGFGGGPQVCTLNPNLWGIDISCRHTEYGWWSFNWQCYVQFANPQPAAGHPVWRGNGPSDGAVYEVTCPWLHGVDDLPWTALGFLRFVPSGGGTVGRLIADALGQLDITGPDIHMAPDPAGAGLVGLPVWMWTPVTEQTWQPTGLRLPVLGFVLVVQAGVDRMVWEMGNGDEVICDDGPGTPYADHYGAAESPDCGYRGYQWPSHDQPDGRYQITATTHWVVDWWFEQPGGSPTGLGAVEATTRVSTTTVRIRELQVVTS